MRIMKMQNLLILLLVLAGSLIFIQCDTDATAEELNDMAIESRDGQTPKANALCTCIGENYPVEILSQEETDAILFMREEEKLARDVYLGLYDKWERRVFRNISRSEQMHMNAMLCLIKKYDLTDPVGDNPVGKFQNAELQALYTTLMATGSEDLVSAFTVGATIEDLDIKDLMTLRDDMDNADIRAVFKELTRGSRNHLRAFVRNLEQQDASYTVQYISEDLFEEIISAPMEKGGTLCDGLAMGNAYGKHKNKGHGHGPGICDHPGGKGGNGGDCDGTGKGGNGNGGNGNGGNGNGGNGNGGNGNGGNGNGGNGNGGNGNGGNGNGGNGNGGNGNGGNGNGGTGNGGNGNGGNGNGGNGNGGNGNGGNGNGGNGNGGG